MIWRSSRHEAVVLVTGRPGAAGAGDIANTAVTIGIEAATAHRIAECSRSWATQQPTIVDVTAYRISVKWGETTVAGMRKFKDAKVFPDSVEEWDWDATGTRHSPGIQPADVEDLVDAGAEAIVLSRGMELRLSVMPETLEYLKSRGIEVYVAETKAAVDLYHQLSASKPTGALIHSTC